jgi:glutamyl-tRNA reductase
MRMSQAAEAVLLETCHRVELITVDADPGTAASQRRGAAAVRRVFEVVAGFDSAVVAEEQLLGQARSAYEDALATGRSGPILNELMQRALRFGRLVRSHARPGTDRSLADPAVAWLHQHLRPADRVVVAGTGEMGRLIAGGLARAGYAVTVLSKSAERGGKVLEGLSGEGHQLAVGPLRREVVSSAAGLALAVRAREPVLTADLLRSPMPQWVADLSSPPAVEPSAREQLGDRLLSLDQLGHRHGATPVLRPETEARLLRRLDGEVAAFASWLDVRRGADALALLHRSAEETRRRHLDRLRRKASLDETQFAAVEAASAAMLGELLHGPTLELRHGGADADTVRRLFRIGS